MNMNMIINIYTAPGQIYIAPGQIHIAPGQINMNMIINI